MIRRATLKPTDATPVDAPAKIRCRSCGVSLPKGQRIAGNHKYFLCSYCKGDPFWGQDGYLLEMIRDELAIIQERHGQKVASQHLLSLVLTAPAARDRRRMSKQWFRNSSTSV